MIKRCIGGLGDAIMTLPAVKGISEKFPRCYITYATSSGYLGGVLVDVLRNIPYIHRIAECSPVKIRAFDAFIDFTPCCGIYEKPGYLGNRIDKFCELAGVQPSSKKPDYVVTQEESIRGLELLKNKFKKRYLRFPRDEKFVAIAPRTMAEKRDWPIHNFAELGSRLQRDLGVIPVYISHEPITKLKDIGIGLWGHDIRSVAAVLSHCVYLVTPDTGIMHLGGALGTRTVVLMGSTPAQAYPYYQDFTFLRDESLPCVRDGGCWYAGCSKGYVCMRNISVTNVIDVISKGVSDSKGGLHKIMHVEKSDPLITVIVPTKGEPVAAKCIRALESTIDERVRVIIVDDCSKHYVNPRGFDIIRTPRTLGYGQCCNLGANRTKSDILVFLNDDVIVKKGWVDDLINRMTGEVAIVGFKLLYPNGTIQHYGKTYDPTTQRFEHDYKGHPARSAGTDVERDVHSVTGAMMAVRRDVFLRAGQFDPIWGLGYFEDDDLCIKVHEMGFRIICSPHENIHYETTSFKKLRDHQLIWETNYRQFKDRWVDREGKLIPQFRGATILPKPAPRKRVENSKDILVFMPTFPEFDTSAGGRKILKVMTELVRMGYTVHLAPDEKQTTNPDVIRRINEVRRRGIIVEPKNLNILREKLPVVRAVLICWPGCRVLPEMVRNRWNAPIYYDSEDIEYRRLRRGIDSGILRMSDDEYQTRKTRELSKYASSDIVLCSTDEDAEFLKRDLPGVRAAVVSHISHYGKEYKPSGKNICFVGGFRHPPNTPAAVYLANEIMPKVWQLDPDVTLHIAGHAPPKEVKALAKRKVKVWGYVENLDEFYEGMSISVNPIIYGAGIKGKICEATAAGLPIITSKEGAEGTGFVNGREAFVCDLRRPDDFARAVIRLLNDPELAKRMVRLAGRRLGVFTSVQAVRSILRGLFDYPKVSLLVITHNHVNLAMQCVTEILRRTDYPNYEVIVIANGCTDSTVEAIKGIGDPRVKVLNLKENLYFTGGNNKVLKHIGNDVVLINDDVTVKDGWLTPLVEEAYTSPTIGIVGGKTLRPDGKISEAGAIMDPLTGRAANRGRGRPASEFNRPDDVDYVSGCLMYIKRTVLDTVGPLDPEFSPFYAEDTDLSFRARHVGFRVRYCPYSVAVHAEGSSCGTDTSKGWKRYQEINKRKFMERHTDPAKVEAAIERLVKLRDVRGLVFDE